MARVTVQFRGWSGIEWRKGGWTAPDDKTRGKLASLAALHTGEPQRAFGRPAPVLDAERVGRLAAAREAGRQLDLPDLNLFYVLDGEAETIARHELVESAVVEPPMGDLRHVKVELDDAARALHERDARGQGVTIATLARAPDLAAVVPEAAIDLIPPFLSLADAIDRASSDLAQGDVVLCPYVLATPSARAAAAHAHERGVVLVTGDDGDAVTRAARAACVQSYAVGVGVGRLAPAELAVLDGFPGDPARSLDALDARVRARKGPRPRARVIFDRARILAGGDLGDAEIYFEGWVDDGNGGRRTFRIPHEGHIPFVKDGQQIPLDTPIYESTLPVGPFLLVHIEAWDEDLGRASLIDPDDLLGAHERKWVEAEKWGSGRHDELRVETDAGAWLLSYRIELDY